MTRLKVGLIGLGEVAQIIHLPVLETLVERFEIAALCDVSPGVLQAMGARYRVTRLYEDYLELVREPDLDVIFVLNSNEYHTDCTLAALQHGKHVLIEKPMCMTLPEADAIIQARDEAGKHVMVGYMRRYAPAFLQAVEEVKAMDVIHYAKIRDIIGQNRLFIQQSSVVSKYDDIPPAAIADCTERRNSLLRDAIGRVPVDLARAYGLLNGLSSHSLSAMREMLGFPQHVASAVTWKGGSFIQAVFAYDGYYATFETGTDGLRRFDGHLEVFGASKQVKVQYDTPYIRHLPTLLHIQETQGEALETREIRPTYKDPYTLELEHLHEVITGSVPLKTTPEDARQDLVLFGWIMERLKVN
ncbi:Gfo/Idh/MocA family protein [Paenibacillus sp. FSL H8-0034]|uniref:Gfo/Idh/MocA family protein n=1 Tax=Paenibacillus sp. FSL H8-0034 TaxID=2954671 RepID=UPI0030FAF3BA